MARISYRLRMEGTHEMLITWPKASSVTRVRFHKLWVPLYNNNLNLVAAKHRTTLEKVLSLESKAGESKHLRTKKMFPN